MNKITINTELLKKTIDQAMKAYPSEGCAVLFGDCEKLIIKEVTFVENQVEAKKADVYYRIDPRTIYELEKETHEDKGQMLGFLHTHPDSTAVVSREDKEYMIPGLIYMIISLNEGIFGDIRAYIKSLDLCKISEYEIISVEL